MYVNQVLAFFVLPMERLFHLLSPLWFPFLQTSLFRCYATCERQALYISIFMHPWVLKGKRCGWTSWRNTLLSWKSYWLQYPSVCSPLVVDRYFIMNDLTTNSDYKERFVLISSLSICICFQCWWLIFLAWYLHCSSLTLLIMLEEARL